MGPHHPHPFHGHGYGYGYGDGGGDGLWPYLPLIVAVLLCLVALWAMLRRPGVAALVAQRRPRMPAGSRARWRAAVARHREIATSFASYECDPQAVLRRPALADVRQPATGRFVDAFAAACALQTDRYPGRSAAEAFTVAAERAANAWTAAVDAAERRRRAAFAPGEHALLDRAAALLTLARNTPHDAERAAAYRRAGEHLADLERRCGWFLPQRTATVLAHEARRGLTGPPAPVSGRNSGRLAA
jgi:hypothetical protein